MAMVVVLCWGAALAWAGDPEWRYEQPVKLDSSGRPIYNSWQSRESLRQSRPSDRSAITVTTSIPLDKAQSVPDAASPQAGPYYANPATRAAGDSAINPVPPVNTYIQVNEDSIPVNTGSQPDQ